MTDPQILKLPEGWTLEALKVELSKEAIRRWGFREFVKQAWHLVEPARPFIPNWCSDAICEGLEEVSAGVTRKAIFNVPPGFAKSTLVSVLWGCWEWTLRPFIRWMYASHAAALSLRDANRRRDIVINSPWYQERWGNKFKLTSDNIKYFTNSAQGSMFSSSTESRDVTGFRAERLVLDDPHDPQGAISDVQRGSTTEWLNLTWPSRLNETKYSAEVLIMQRLHEADASGLYLKQGGWKHYKIPMEYKGKTYCIADKRTQIGQLIDDRVYSRAYVEDKKKRFGEWGEAAQYDQEPQPLGGGMIRRKWLENSWSPAEHNPGHIVIKNGLYTFDPFKTFRFATVDLAMTEKEIGPKKLHDPDWTVMAAWSALSTPGGTELCLMDIVRVRMEGPESMSLLQGLHRHWRFHSLYIEDVMEKSWYQHARRAGLPVREISTRKNDDEAALTIDGGKTDRVYTASILMSNMRLHLPDYAPWKSEFVSECTSFPNAAHDDQVDVLAYACAIAEKYKGDPIRGQEEKRFEGDRYTDHPDRRRQDEPRQQLEGFHSTGGLQGWRSGG